MKQNKQLPPQNLKRRARQALQVRGSGVSWPTCGADGGGLEGAVVICHFSQDGLGLNLSDQGRVAIREYEDIGTKVGVGIPCRSFVVLLWVCVWGLTHCCVAWSRWLNLLSLNSHFKGGNGMFCVPLRLVKTVGEIWRQRFGWCLMGSRAYTRERRP